MKNRYVFLFGAIIVVMALYFLNRGKLKSADADTDNEISDTDSEPKKNPQILPTTSVSATVTAVSATAEVKPNNQVSDEVMRKFALNLVEVQKCLAFSAKSAGPDMAAPSIDNLLVMLRPNLGEVIVQLDDWQQFDYIDKSNVKKRARVDIDYPDGVTPTRRLSLFTYNAYNTLEIDNLTNDQSDNPNLAYIESLKEGSQVLSEERAARYYFHQGEELVYTIKNGNLDSFNISRADRAINCTNMSTEAARCSCP
ncbi:MAG: hypothetical protein ACXWQQ_02475 [Pseudobdellovibrio sp.]